MPTWSGVSKHNGKVVEYNDYFEFLHNTDHDADLKLWEREHYLYIELPVIVLIVITSIAFLFMMFS